MISYLLLSGRADYPEQELLFPHVGNGFTKLRWVARFGAIILAARGAYCRSVRFRTKIELPVRDVKSFAHHFRGFITSVLSFPWIGFDCDSPPETLEYREIRGSYGECLFGRGKKSSWRIVPNREKDQNMIVCLTLFCSVCLRAKGGTHSPPIIK